VALRLVRVRRGCGGSLNFASRSAMNIEGLGESARRPADLLDLVHDCADLYR
jgi:NAD-dependent DNA ligase